MGAYFVIFATFLVALSLQILPLPDYVQFYRPNWVAIILIYWSMALPNTIRLLAAFGAGIIVDIMLGTLLGQHAIAFVIIIYINLFLSLRIRVLPLGRQAIYVLILLTITQFLIAWVEGISGSNPPIEAFFLPALTGMFIWPWAFIILRDIRRGTHI
ncbi:MAG: rod shape-determining protein MreD [Gammaproteobacteria bacterium]|nr:rod shape-determining protein MreD [Gammaproteobacteria bacterium]